MKPTILGMFMDMDTVQVTSLGVKSSAHNKPHRNKLFLKNNFKKYDFLFQDDTTKVSIPSTTVFIFYV